MADRMSEEEIDALIADAQSWEQFSGDTRDGIVNAAIQLRAELAEVKERLRWMTEDRDRHIAVLADCGQRYDRLSSAVRWFARTLLEDKGTEMKQWCLDSLGESADDKRHAATLLRVLQEKDGEHE